MRVINCLCGARIESTDGADLYAALRAHADEEHHDARITDADISRMIVASTRTAPWDGQRVTPAALDVRPLTPERADDFLRFFDRDAFQDNPAWWGCYCWFFHADGDPERFDSRRPEENRADKAAAIRRGEARGYLAYAGDAVAGWCHAAPRTSLPGLDFYEDLRTHDAADAGAIVCFVVAAPYRRQGVARRLLDAACEGFRRDGFAFAEAYPPSGDVPSDARAFRGTRAMYAAAGFVEHRTGSRWMIMRKPLH